MSSAPPETPTVDSALARRLLAGAFPRWAELPLRPVLPGGSDHLIYRLGDDLSVRFPRGTWSAGQARKEARWLPLIAPRLPLPVPEPVAVGEPALGYPWHWSVSRWLDGEQATPEALADPEESARQLGAFLVALHRLPPAETLLPGHDQRELAIGTLAARDAATRGAIAAVGDTISDSFGADALTELWDAALTAPAWQGPPAWVHGDFHVGNLLVTDGRISAVIDFGGLGLGDPAADLVVAWTLMTAETRPHFRAASGLDDATWLRGRGWALATGLNAYHSYAATRPDVARATTRQIIQALRG
ncbi:aminoglycoside phosphotransferase family protein [Streptomyces triticirhizae]|uniref:Aminoglycoside phosphotransferase family protein n=1 Tax=Streptomyces triticirhizae TaxID=2483353 RepID=A0A3M2LIK7_9ACTN|nr:aminoglycoside phosphotransferase family protein [Streptomyces triticirhizae]RMI34608.1 aminoglycoside phosphotransferase family protein [Streptomyces triticirhizae]